MGQTMQAAALAAGYGNTPEAARTQGHKVIRSDTVRSALELALDAAGATIQKSAEVVAAAMDATSTKMVKVVGRAGKMVPIDGPDHYARLKAADLGCKWRGIGQQSDTEIHGTKISLAILIVHERERRGLEPIPAHIVNAHAEPEQSGGAV